MIVNCVCIAKNGDWLFDFAHAFNSKSKILRSKLNLNAYLLICVNTYIHFVKHIMWYKFCTEYE